VIARFVPSTAECLRGAFSILSASAGAGDATRVEGEAKIDERSDLSADFCDCAITQASPSIV
jgi:hypothetical protein